MNCSIGPGNRESTDIGLAQQLTSLTPADAEAVKKLRVEFGGQGKSNINLDWREQKRK